MAEKFNLKILVSYEELLLLEEMKRVQAKIIKSKT